MMNIKRVQEVFLDSFLFFRDIILGKKYVFLIFAAVESIFERIL